MKISSTCTQTLNINTFDNERKIIFGDYILKLICYTILIKITFTLIQCCSSLFAGIQGYEHDGFHNNSVGRYSGEVATSCNTEARFWRETIEYMYPY